MGFTGTKAKLSLMVRRLNIDQSPVGKVKSQRSDYLCGSVMHVSHNGFAIVLIVFAHLESIKYLKKIKCR